MNWTLVVVAAVILVSTIIGASKGIIKMVFSCLSLIVVIAVTTFVAPHIGRFVREHTQLDESVRDKTETYFEEKGLLMSADGQIDPEELPFPVTIRESVAESAQTYLQSGYDAYNNYIVDTVAGIIFSAIIYVAVFLLLTIILTVLSCALRLVSRLPVLKQLNKLAGGIVGALLGLLIVWVIFIIITIFGTRSFAETVFSDINSNPVLLFLYDKNIILHFLLNLF